MSRKDEAARGKGRQAVPSQQEAKRAAILASLRVGNTRRAACGIARIHHSTFYTWMHDEPDFAAEVAGAEAEAEAEYVQSIKNAIPNDWRAAALWLERRRPKEWGRNDTITTIQRISRELDALSDEELMKLAYELSEDEMDDPVRVAGR